MNYHLKGVSSVKKNKELHAILNVLCLEDDLKDAELLNEILADADYMVSMDIAAGKKEYVAFLKRKNYDIVLADNSVSNFDALAALKMTLSLKPEIPFICVSGTIGEEKAIELLKQGASDYLMKDKLSKLAFSVKRALKEKELQKENRHTQDVLIESEERYSKAFQLSPYAITITRVKDGRFVDVNDAFTSISGFTKEEALNNSAVGLNIWADIEDRKSVISALIAGKSVTGKEFLFKKKNGEIMTGLFSAKTIHVKNESCILSSINDITKLKNAEEENNRQKDLLQRVIDNIPVMITYFYNNGKILLTNNELIKGLGWTHHEWETENIFEKCYPDPKYMKEVLDFMNSGESGWKDCRTNTKYGTIIDTSWKNIKLSDGVSMGIGQDITERKKREEALHHSYVFNETLLKTIPFGMEIVDEKGTVLFQNDNLKRIVGFDAIGKKCCELFHDDKNHPTDCPLAKGIIIGKTDTFESNGVLCNRIFEINHAGIMYHGKKAILEIFQDITERKNKEVELEKEKRLAEDNEKKFRNLFEHSPVGKSMTGIDGTIHVNKSFCEIVGYSEEELRGKKWVEISHPEDIPFTNEKIQSLLKGEIEKAVFEKRYIHKNGNTVWTQLSTYLMRDKDNIPQYFITSMIDITERKQAEKKLLRSEHELKKAQQLTHIGSWYLDVATNEVVWTEELYKMYGFNPELPPPPYTEHMKLFTPESWELLSSSLTKTSETGVPYELELQTVRKDGSNGWMWVRGEAQADSDGNIVGLWGAAQDISERKNREKQLEDAKEKAEESERLKSAFLANMSHEIRTPMNGILGFTELLKEPNLSTDDQQDFIQTIQISGERMLNTINNLVDVSKIESGLTTVVIDETNINKKIEFAYKFFKPEVERKGLQFIVKNGLSTNDAVIRTDNEKVYGVLTNLIKNAVKFTYDGSIEFGYILKGKFLEFYVKDTGVGIPKNLQQTIFERFRQGSNDLNRLYEGSGLGLSIAKSYVEMLGGNIWVESEESKGSTFYFTIPYHSVEELKTEIQGVDSSEIIKVQMKNLKILIVEDDEVSYSLLKRTMQKIGKEVLHAITGVEAIEACRANPDLDLVLMDIRMPIMDGNEATRQIRQFNKDVIIIAQTAYAFAGDYEKAIEAGCNAYISKPINVTALFELIKKYVNK
jgi:PAS domain S-box-containing protein